MPLATLLLMCIFCAPIEANDSTTLYYRVYRFPDRLFGAINSKSQGLQNQLTKQTEKYLSRLSRQENKLKRQPSGKIFTATKKSSVDVDKTSSQEIVDGVQLQL